jgi:hypothetical protein
MKSNKIKMRKTKSRKMKRTMRKQKGGDVFGPVSSTTLNPYTTYDVNTNDNDVSRQIQSSRLIGGNKTRKNKLKKGGRFISPILLKHDHDRPVIV